MTQATISREVEARKINHCVERIRYSKKVETLIKSEQSGKDLTYGEIQG